MSKVVIAFDLFGTILSTDSIGDEIGKIYGQEAAKAIAPLARRYQLEYTWRCNSMGVYKPFDELTRWSFHQAISEVVGLPDGWPQKDQDRIMKAYNGLSPYPDVEAALATLRENPNVEVYIFSNGTREMLSSTLINCKPPHVAEALKEIFPETAHISVDDDALKVYKPDPKTYEYVAVATGRAFAQESVWLVSSNPFDIVGARKAGMRTAWVDRGEKGWTDGLGNCLDVVKNGVFKAKDLHLAVQHIVGEGA